MKIYSTVNETITPEQQQAIEQAFALAGNENDALITSIKDGCYVVRDFETDETEFLLNISTLEIIQQKS